MIIFKTNRLQIKALNENDKSFFVELLSAPEIIEPIPQTKWSLGKILILFEDAIKYIGNPLTKEKVIWGVYERDSYDFSHHYKS